MALCAITGAVGIESERQYDDITDVIDGDPDGEGGFEGVQWFPKCISDWFDLLFFIFNLAADDQIEENVKPWYGEGDTWRYMNYFGRE